MRQHGMHSSPKSVHNKDNFSHNSNCKISMNTTLQNANNNDNKIRNPFKLNQVAPEFNYNLSSMVIQ